MVKAGRALLVGPGALTPMDASRFDQEDDLQSLIAAQPELLGGDQLRPEAPRRWLLVRREIGVPTDTAGASVFSLDHPFLDQDGIPTFVECKRGLDTRARREVVAHMLDYAANGRAFWSPETIRAGAEETARTAGSDLRQELTRLLDDEGFGEAGDDAYADFWRRVEDNLRLGRVRLLSVVADGVAASLRRLVEFLNEKLQDVEVAIVEIRQYVGAGQAVVAPAVIGLTERARGLKRRASVLDSQGLIDAASPEARPFFEYGLRAAEADDVVLSFGIASFAVRVLAHPGARPVSIAYFQLPGTFSVYVEYLNLSADHDAELRNLVAAYGLKSSGKHSLVATVTPTNLEDVKAAFDATLNWVQRHLAAASTNSREGD